MADEPPPLCPSLACENEKSLMEEMMSVATQAKAKKDAVKLVQEKKRNTSFGDGLKKGFFTTSKPKAKPTKDIPTIRPKVAKSDSLKLPEVQKAMEGLQSKDWMTPDFFQKLASDPKLCTALQNPRFTAAIQELSSNPEQAMRKYQNDQAVTTMLKDFMQFMGVHFEQLGKEVEAKEVKEQQRQALEAAAQTPDEKAQVERILGDPELQAILSDTHMQTILKRCQEPGVLLQYLHDPIIGTKIRKLQSAGLVQLHP